MDLKLFSAEFVADHIQLTYTDDGLEPKKTGSLLVLRVPAASSFNTSLNMHQRDALEQVHAWAAEEFDRLTTQIKERR